ncbi:MAG: hypothetical protein BAJALOKI1v1_980002 [Promethearchaeota archaeon]|nr:MAG: hypothetical protein BAJALOKI1v1_980002 [Candidatus Lokiarchaeota archaeon]
MGDLSLIERFTKIFVIKIITQERNNDTIERRNSFKDMVIKQIIIILLKKSGV